MLHKIYLGSEQINGDTSTDIYPETDMLEYRITVKNDR